MRWSKNENLICEELGDGALLVEVSTGKRWLLNKAAAALWRLNDARLSVAEFVAVLRTTEVFQMAPSGIPSIKELGLGAGPRRRPTPRGNSGPG